MKQIAKLFIKMAKQLGLSEDGSIIREVQKQGDVSGNQWSVLEAMVSSEVQDYQRHDDNGAYSEKCSYGYTYIAKILANMMPDMSAIINQTTPEDLHFVDLGSGYGNKVYVAHLAGFGKCTGIEYDPLMVANSHHYGFSGSNTASLRNIQGNVLHCTLDHYDVIYFYEPIRRSYEQMLFHARVMKHSKIGCYFLPYTICSVWDRLWNDPKVFRRLGNTNAREKIAHPKESTIQIMERMRRTHQRWPKSQRRSVAKYNCDIAHHNLFQHCDTLHQVRKDDE